MKFVCIELIQKLVIAIKWSLMIFRHYLLLLFCVFIVFKSVLLIEKLTQEVVDKSL